MNSFKYNPELDTYLWGDLNNGIGLYFDKLTSKWIANAVVNNDIHCIGDFDSYCLAENAAINAYKELKDGN
jgi:hypothetical protein